MQFAVKTSVIAVFAALATSACTLGPSGAPPAMPSPAHYGAQPQSLQTVAAGGTAQHFDAGATAAPQWWTLYRSDALDALVEEGLRNNPTLAATQRSLNAAQQELRAQIGASTLPSVDAGAEAERTRSPVVPGIGPNTERYNVFAGQLQAQYNFDLFGAVRYGNKASAARVDVQAYELEAARRALAANIVGTAIRAAALDRQIALTERLVTLAGDMARDDAQRQALGSVSHAQALGSARQAAALAATLPPLRQQRASTVHALAVLLGRTPDATPAVPDLDSLSLPEHVPVAVPAQLLRSRPDIRAAEAAVQAAAADVGEATAQLFPNLSLTASMGRAGFSWPALLSGAGGIWAIGASVSQPIFHGGALLAHRRATKEAYEAAVLHYKSTVLSAFGNVADSLAALDNDAQTLASTESEARAAQQLFDETTSRYRLGSLPISAAQASEQQFLTARLDAVRAQSQRLGDTAALFQAMGELPQEPAKSASRE
ncbi:efflux transporter outer membrane subunit [Paraburkholderia phenoliruptrix]|uniref:NodT family RND efflux system, outer membrane lipoprotein n=2 Tax=Paraburkholderia phenoliruptrix TaxID=252970 RepID=K0E004_9BURK|nr:efflux transporter outer membrane subunit [Paraburkholderia phenoliruptrix]AFT89693.1 NodT family RND efflux system, outer membrane lipoprotein [Paraburkholderia phenoliruptrix BR3459a]MDR6422787.1 NodT family efflux transporter outer membrane factor (OMF) lipoprotein [Paraburkholderia phenoliruptrix]CAB4051612.1 Toluene efflux pump outer membrane protein TtgI [Paraburkholderia phenoliruptrix]